MSKTDYFSFFDDCDDNPEFFNKSNSLEFIKEGRPGLTDLFNTIFQLRFCDWCNEEIATIEIITTQGKWFICDKCMPVDGEVFPKCQKTLKISEIDFSETIRTARNILKNYRFDI